MGASYAGVTKKERCSHRVSKAFPHRGANFSLSSGDAGDAPGNLSTFASTGFENGRQFSSYSPDEYDAYDVVDLEIDVQIADGAEGIAFEFNFATDESPNFLDSVFQDFFEAQLIIPDDEITNIALINGKPVTVDNVDEVAYAGWRFRVLISPSS